MKAARVKAWGRVYARPSEYMIKLHKGKIVAHGPGLSVWIWRGDTYTILPTSIQRTSFVADQITAEKVGVAVTGMAVFRIADPLLAFSMIDFEDGTKGIEQLAAILREMFIGAARRLVANMTVEECLTRRKESIAQELMREIQPVVAGSGRLEDDMDRGWGVIIDTIEIQDVRILSEKVFADLQAPFRNELELQARRAVVQRDQEIHLRQVVAQHKMLAADQEYAQSEAAAEEQKRLQALAREERLHSARAEMEQRIAASRLAAELAQHERDRALAEAQHAFTQQQAEASAQLEQQRERQRSELARQVAADEADVQQLQHEHQLQLAELAKRVAEHQVAKERLRAELQLELQQRQRSLENQFSSERLQHEFVTCALPAVAQAFIKSLGDVHLTRFSTSGQEPGLLAETVAQVLEVARSAGLDLGHVLGGKSPEQR